MSVTLTLDPRDAVGNVANLTDALAKHEEVRVNAPPGPILFQGTVSVPASKKLAVVGPLATLVQAGKGPLFSIAAPGRADVWRGEFRLTGVGCENRTAPSVTTSGRPALARFVLDDCSFISSGPHYAVDLDIAYSVAPLIRGCRFGGISGGSGLRIRGDVHTCSGLKVADTRFHFQQDKAGPCVWLEGCQMAHLLDTIIEGTSGFAAGVDVAACLDTEGLLVVNPGFRSSNYENLWFEWWGMPPASRSVMRIHQALAKHAGAYAPGPQVVRNLSGRLTVSTAAETLDPLVVYVQNIDAGTLGSLRVEGRGQIIADDAGTAPLSSPLVVDPRIVVRSTLQADAESRRSVVSGPPAARQLYRYAGGTGASSPVFVPGRLDSGRAIPHRHPVHGACLAVRGTPTIHGAVLAGPSGRKGTPLRIHTGVLVASPHAARTGNGPRTSVRLSVANTTTTSLWVPDGFDPVPFFFTDVGDEPSSYLAFTGTPYPGLGGGPYPGGMWVLVYAAAASTDGQPVLNPPGHGPVRCYELTPDAGPPPGTWQAGDVVMARTAAGTAWTCTAPGTSRPLAFSARGQASSPVLQDATNLVDLLEGDWVTTGSAAPARVLRIAADGKVELDRPLPGSGPAMTLKNAPPSWARK